MEARQFFNILLNVLLFDVHVLKQMPILCHFLMIENTQFCEQTI